MSDRSRTENNRNEESKEEKLFRAMSGVDEELLLRSEQSENGNSGKVHKFPARYVSRIAAACLCFVVAGVLYVTMSSTKMADSTGNDTAAPQLAYSVTGDMAIPEENEATPAEQYAAAQAEEAGNDVGMGGEVMSGATMAEDAAELPEGALEAAKQGSTITEEASELPKGALSGAADSGTPEKQDSQMSEAGADSCCDGGAMESSAESAMQEEEVIEKQGRHLPGKMTRKGL